MGDTIRIYVFYSNSNSNNSDPYLPIPVLDKIQGKINFIVYFTIFLTNKRKFK